MFNRVLSLLCLVVFASLLNGFILVYSNFVLVGSIEAGSCFYIFLVQFINCLFDSPSFSP